MKDNEKKQKLEDWLKEEKNREDITEGALFIVETNLTLLERVRFDNSVLSDSWEDFLLGFRQAYMGRVASALFPDAQPLVDRQNNREQAEECEKIQNMFSLIPFRDLERFNAKMQEELSLQKSGEKKEPVDPKETTLAAHPQARWYVCQWRQSINPGYSGDLYVDSVESVSYPFDQKDQADKRVDSLLRSAARTGEDIDFSARFADSAEEARAGNFLDERW